MSVKPRSEPDAVMRRDWDARFGSRSWTLLPAEPLSPVMQTAMDETLTLSTGAERRGPSLNPRGAGPSIGR